VSRKRWIVLLAVAAVAITSAIWSLRDEYDAARVTTAYVAKQTCSCVHVSGRALDACIAELPADRTHQVEVSQDATHMRASILFGVASAQASYEDNYGCRLLD
jgi:hypothetical protein